MFLSRKSYLVFGNILGKSAFENFFTVANVLEIALQLGKAVDFKVNVNFTNQVKE